MKNKTFMKQAIILSGLGLGLTEVLVILYIFILAFHNGDYSVLLLVNQFHEAHIELVLIVLSIVVIVLSGVLVCLDIRKESRVK